MQFSSLNKRDHHKDAGERSKILKGIFVHRTFTLANRKTEVEDYCPKHFSICINLLLFYFCVFQTVWLGRGGEETVTVFLFYTAHGSSSNSDETQAM